MAPGPTGRIRRTTQPRRGRPTGRPPIALDPIHGLLAQIALVLAALTALLAAGLALVRRTPGTFLAGGLLWTGLAVAVAALTGVGVALAEHFPRDPLHVLYGLLAVSALPAAGLIARGRPGNQPAATWAIAGIVLVILVLRLFQTGG